MGILREAEHVRVELAENQGRVADARSDMFASTADLYDRIYPEFKAYRLEAANVGCDWR